MVDKIVYVPQAKCGRLFRGSNNLQVIGLYTDGFSCCNIIVFLDDNKISLIHFDADFNPEHVIKEYQWVGEHCEVVVIYRQEFHGTDVNEILMVGITGVIPTITPHRVSVDTIGVYVSFDSAVGSSIHQKIKLCHSNESPGNLLHHPLEYGFTNVIKIKQVIGAPRRCAIKHRVQEVHACIFDGEQWQVIPDQELLVESKEIESYNQKSDFKEVIFTTANIITAAKKNGVRFSLDPLQHALDIYSNLFPYLNPGDKAETLFDKHMQGVFKYVKTTEDREYANRLKQLLGKPDTHDHIVKLINELRKITGTPFTIEVINSYDSCSYQYWHAADIVAEWVESARIQAKLYATRASEFIQGEQTLMAADYYYQVARLYIPKPLKVANILFLLFAGLTGESSF